MSYTRHAASGILLAAHVIRLNLVTHPARQCKRCSNLFQTNLSLTCRFNATRIILGYRLASN
ncbi:hypothetical protein HMPREF0454_02660 [Hafnia alvei ATCC 51873]|uniref:Uncharacterized protein n=1 Tax=Hafnia alvei ATCC 51873 TaxID=1002364 RepID=G9Y7K8_HAFAL|nr:hypothetical protein HMPREF0454_02660 [Hafnia alvei ATCC 51873]